MMLDALTVYETDVPKIRYGANLDGGYVLADLPSYDSLISFGVGGTCTFEEDFAKAHNAPIYGFDHTIGPDMAATFNSVPNAQWIKKGVGPETTGDILSISDIIKMTGITGTNNLLQMDIEGAEWPLFDQFDVNLYQPFSQILIELHMSPGRGSITAERLAGLAKLNELYYCVHTHGNNHSITYNINNETLVPYTLESTYLRKDLAANVRLNTLALPDPILDFPCHPTRRPDWDLNHWPFVTKEV